MGKSNRIHSLVLSHDYVNKMSTGFKKFKLSKKSLYTSWDSDDNCFIYFHDWIECSKQFKMWWDIPCGSYISNFVLFFDLIRSLWFYNGYEAKN